MPDKRRRIVDAILGAAAAFPTPGAFRAKLADLLLIYCQEHAYLAMWVDGERVLASHPDHELQAFRARHPRNSGLDPLDRSDARSPAGTSGFELVLRSMPKGTPRAADAEKLLAEVVIADEDVGHFALELLSKPEPAGHLGAAPEDSRTARLEPGQLEKLLKPFRERLEGSLASLALERSPLLGRWRGEDLVGGCRNLFTVVRYAPELPYSRPVSDGRGWEHDYGYAARMLVPQGLEPLLSEILESTRGEERSQIAARELLEWPLGPGSRAIGDTPLESGTVHLADLGDRAPGETQRDIPGPEPTAQARHRLETAFYQRVFPGATQAAYAPVHVAGTPWLCLFSLNDEKDEKASFLRNYLLYREVVPVVADRARVAAREAFLDCLVDAFRQELSADLSDTRLARINDSWLRASMVYPFPICSLERMPVGPGEESPPGHVRLGPHQLLVSLGQAVPALRPQLLYGELTVRDVVSRIQAESYAVRDRSRQARESALEDVLHGTTTAVRAIKIRDLAQALSRTRKVPLTDVSDFRFKVMRLKGDGEHTEVAEALLRGLNDATVAYESSLALLQLGELSLHRGPVRRKFQSAGRTPIRTLVEEARSLALASLPPSHSGGLQGVDLTFREEGPSTGPGQWLIPDGYIDVSILRGILAEMIKNAVEHGQADDARKLPLEAALGALSAGGLSVVLANPSAPSVSPESARSGFLKRTMLLLQDLEGIRLVFDRQGDRFLAGLELGPIEAETAGGRARVVTPLWDAAQREDPWPSGR